MVPKGSANSLLVFERNVSDIQADLHEQMLLLFFEGSKEQVQQFSVWKHLYQVEK